MKTHKEAIAVFDHLSTEYEKAWLLDAFVQPSLAKPIDGKRSVVISGQRGSGKSALAYWLQQQANANATPILASTWIPQLSRHDQDGYQASQSQIQQIFQSCITALLHFLGHHPAYFSDAPHWVQDLLHWFIHHYSATVVPITLGRLQSSLPEAGYQTIREILTTTPAEISMMELSHTEKLELLMSALCEIDIQDVWILIDGLEPWLEIDDTLLAKALEILLATLNLFEIPGFAFKLFVPQPLTPQILRASGIYTRRLDLVELTWSTQQLADIVERRLQIATANPEIRLSQITETAKFIKHLETYGGLRPRGWLEMARPFIDYYLFFKKCMPLTEPDFDTVFEQNPPRLRIAPRTADLYLGYQHLPPLSPQQSAVLNYLYNKNHEFCSREELYYCAVLGHARVSQRGDQNFEEVIHWKSGFENIIYQLRKRIEPLEDKSLYLETRRNRGYRLNHTA